MLDFSVTFFITFINIAVLFFVLRAILFKPVTKLMEERSAKIKNDIAEAEKEKNQAKRLGREYEERMKNAEAEAALIIREAHETALEEAARIVAAGKEEAEAILARSRSQIEAEKQTALVQFRAEAAVLVVSASSRLLGRELTGEDSRRQAALLLRELGNTV